MNILGLSKKSQENDKHKQIEQKICLVKTKTKHKHIPEPWDHLCKANDLLNAIGDKISQVGQHGKAGGLLLTGVRATALLVVHHQQVVEVHFGVHRLCSEQEKGRTAGWVRKREKKKRKGREG